MPSILGAKYARDLFQELGRKPHEKAVRVDCKGRFEDLILSARHAYRVNYHHRHCPGVRHVTFTGGCLITIRLWGNNVVDTKCFQARLKPEWKEDTFYRAVQRLMDKGLRAINHRNLATQLHEMVQPLLVPPGEEATPQTIAWDEFLKQKEKEGHPVAYDEMSIEDIYQWMEWVQDFALRNKPC